MLENFSFVAIVAALGTALALLMLLRMVTAGPSQQVRKRLARVTRPGTMSASNDDRASLRRDGDDSRIPFVDILFKWLVPRPALLRQRLERTGFRLKPGEYGLICFVVAGIVGVLIHQVFGMSPAVAILSGISAGLGLPHLTISFLINRRIKAFIAEFPAAIDLIVRGLKSGLPVPESIRTVSTEMNDPIRAEFRSVTEKIKLGVSLDDALADVAERITAPEYRFFIISLAVQRETGGNLAETLENLSDILRKRRQMRLKIKAMSSEANASAGILGSLPFAVFGILAALNPDYVGLLFTDPRGHLMLGVGLGSLSVGIFVMRKMARFEI